MTTPISRTTWAAAAAVLAALSLGACGSDSDDDRAPTPSPARYTITLTNLTANQPLAPAAIILHDGGYAAWEAGAPASAGLEVLAESGSPADLTAEAAASPRVVATAAGTAVLGPGMSSDVNVEGVIGSAVQLSVAAMLVNTNDAFAGTAALDLGGLGVGETRAALLAPYDAGTEVNAETAATVPGPAGGGEGFNAADGEGFVAVHPGVVTAADGLATSSLDESHRFQSPVARVRVVRTR